jgi:hypothetical protein
MKSGLITRLRILGLSLLLSLPAAASWTSFVTMGSTTVGPNPSCASADAGQATCAATSLSHTLVVNQFNAARGQTGAVLAAVWNGTDWSELTFIGGQVTSAPSCAALRAGHVLCAARSVSGGLTSSVFNGTSWSSFSNLSGKTTVGPGCASDGAGDVICATVSTTSTVLANRFNGTKWNKFLDLGGQATSPINCTPMAIRGQVACFAKGSNTGYWGNRFNGGDWNINQWTGWGTLGGLVNPGGSCTAFGAGDLICGVVGVTDSALWINQLEGNWLGFERVGQTAVGNPGCTSLGSGKVLCAIVGVNSKASSTVGP